MTGFTLHLLRHGATIEPGLMLGRTDGEPGAEGIADCMARAGGLEVERVIASDLRRASLAGEAIAARLGLPLAIDPRWRELDFGDWDGLAPAAIEPGAFARFHDDPDANPPPGGERWSALVARVGEGIDALAPVPTLVVTHGGAMRAALHRLCGFELRQCWAFDLRNGALLSLRVWPDERAAQIFGLST